ncbi:NADPH:quinone oxidoreductase MdaB [Sinobacterium norvegicum]|uniref:NADPH:quinone oxidoreductase MdaB n=1 Tax=Sinobacterium norvegicum TaxID=1641715 RepID=A0ABM9ADF7_9GAMM|nr:NAD(P)H-dependent oxidoreductase [Sinobacterium norvegicum]CAH0991234.1 NADPH:quinone oxidoreductase MdaB [Sinobacterium norvegicum]
MKILIVAAGYSIFDAKGQLNGYLAYLTEQNLAAKNHQVRISDVSTASWDVDREVAKLLWADTIVYITPIMWFNMPAPMVQWLDEVLLYNKTFVITDDYGEGGLLPAEKFMIVTSSNLKRSDLGKGMVLKNASHIDDVMQPLIMTNHYLSVRTQLPTFHADNVVAGKTDWIEQQYVHHLDQHFSAA